MSGGSFEEHAREAAAHRQRNPPPAWPPLASIAVDFETVALAVIREHGGTISTYQHAVLCIAQGIAKRYHVEDSTRLADSARRLVTKLVESGQLTYARALDAAVPPLQETPP